ncbi:MAG: hypothetical protein ISS28_08665 [Candidatus Cloacimonetes bacterium]|nr:hypothetical protein [Actinomycetota bacterium]MBL7087145.1 hypothetical protein [Candidatus Cloacimonadota bacterium]
MNRDQRTRDRFDGYIALEEKIIKNIPIFKPWYKDIVKGHKYHGTSYHDYKILLKDGSEELLQVQLSNYGNERSGYCRYHDIRLDLISSFDPWDVEGRKKYHDFGWRWKTLKNTKELKDFASLCTVNKWGKLKTCDAKIFLFCVAKTKGRGTNKTIKEIILLNLYDNEKLKDNCDYFVNNYGVKINHKIKEPWGSAFVPVSEDDHILKSCMINYKRDFLKVCYS